MNKKIIFSLITALSVTILNATEMKPVGFKAAGMGGTGVANSRGSLAGYYNPALLRFSKYTTELSFNIGGRVRESNLIEPMDKLSDIEFGTTMDRISENIEDGKKFLDLNGDGDGNDEDEIDTRDTGISNSQLDRNNLKEAISILTNDIGTNNAFELSLLPSFTMQMSDAFALGIYVDASLGFRLSIDNNYNQLITTESGVVDGENVTLYYGYNPDTDVYFGSTDSTQYESSSLEYATNEGINYIAVDSVMLTEMPISYAKLVENNNGLLSFGISIKPMKLTTASKVLELGESSEDAEDDGDDEAYETTYKSTFGIDLGVAFIPNDSSITFGLVGKNINSPKFKVDKSETGITKSYTVDPLFRAGMSMPILSDDVEFALDIDLQKNDTIIAGEKAQNIGLGIEYSPTSWASVRFGLMQDIASKKFDDGNIYTAGFGFGFKWIQMDLSAMMSSKSGTYEGEEIPRYSSVNFSLISKWGDGYNRKEVPNENAAEAVTYNSSDVNEEKKEEITEENKEENKTDDETKTDETKSEELKEEEVKI